MRNYQVEEYIVIGMTFIVVLAISYIYLFLSKKLLHLLKGVNIITLIGGICIGGAIWLVEMNIRSISRPDGTLQMNVLEDGISLCLAIGATLIPLFLFKVRSRSIFKLGVTGVIISSVLTVIYFLEIEALSNIFGLSNAEIIIVSFIAIPILTTYLIVSYKFQQEASVLQKSIIIIVALTAFINMHIFTLPSQGEISATKVDIVLFLLLLASIFCLVLIYLILTKRKDAFIYERRYKSLVENSPFFVCELNEKGEILSSNNYFKSLLNLNGEKKLLSLYDIFPPKEKLKFKQATTAVQQGESQFFEAEIINNNGRKFIVDIVLIPIIVDFKVVRMFFSGRNLTKQRDAEKSLLMARSELEETISHQQGMIIKINKLDDDFIISTCEGELVSKLNIKKIDGTQTKVEEYFPADLREKLLPYFQLAWQGQPTDGEITYKGVTFYTRFRPIVKLGKVTSVVASSIDVSERKKAQTELKDSEKLYQKMLESMNEGVIVYNKEGKIVKANERAAEILSLKYSELLERKPLEVVIIGKDKHEDSFYEMACPSTVTYYEGKPVYNKVFSIKKTESESIWVLFNSIPIYKEKVLGPEYVILTITDITEQKQQELKLRQANTNLNALIENLNNGIILENTEREIVFVNEFFIEAFSNNSHRQLKEQYIGNKLIKILENEQEHIVNYSRVYSDISEEKVRKHNKTSFIKMENGKLLELQFSPIVDRGHQVGGIWRLEDVTKQKQYETILVDAKKEAEQANLSKAKFISSMNHELRTPLNAIIGFAQLMKYEEKNNFTDLQKENVQEILTAGRHLMKLINDILDFSQLESGNISMSMKVVEITAIVEEAINMLQPTAKKKNVTIKHKLPKETSLYIEVDPMRMKQVLLNLISNGIKYNKSNGELTIRYEIDNITREVKINVEDTGIGITSEELSKIFTPFYRIKDSNYSIEGSGIGLSLAKEYVERMGGNIGVQSTEQIGSCFWVKLKLYEDTINNVSTEYPLTMGTSLTLNESIQMIYIEDNYTNINLVRKLLKKENKISFHYALTGEEGIELVRKIKPDVILLDIHLPDQSGIEVLTQLKRENLCSRAIAITADSTIKAAELHKVGFHQIVTKPFQVGYFLEAIAKTLK